MFKKKIGSRKGKLIGFSLQIFSIIMFACQPGVGGGLSLVLQIKSENIHTFWLL